MRLGKEFVPTRDPEEVVFPRLRTISQNPPNPSNSAEAFPQKPPPPAQRTIVPMEIDHMRYSRKLQGPPNALQHC